MISTTYGHRDRHDLVIADHKYIFYGISEEVFQTETNIYGGGHHERTHDGDSGDQALSRIITFVSSVCKEKLNFC